MLKTTALLAFIIASATTGLAYGQDLQEGRIVGWGTRVDRYNPGSLRLQDLGYLYKVRSADRIIEFAAEKGEFRLGDAIKFEVFDDDHLQMQRNGKNRKYQVTGMQMESPSK